MKQVILYNFIAIFDMYILVGGIRLVVTEYFNQKFKYIDRCANDKYRSASLHN